MIKTIKKTLFIFTLFLAWNLQAQEVVINGTVTDAESKAPIPGATVIIKGTATGTPTDLDGNFSLKVNVGSVLAISSIGYKTYEVTVGNQTNLSIELIPDTSELEEVVVIGYGTQKKENLTGSISTMKAEDLVQNNTQDVSSALAGRLAGVITIQSSGEPGSSTSTINIRGVSSINNSNPLILVDGIPRSLNNLNSRDIESISVLKDAAASAIYGMRAANGVVLITTKRGKGKNKINVNVYSGINKPTRLPNFLDSYNYATLLNEANANDGVAAAYTDEDLQKFRDGSSPDTHPNTDWLGETLKSNSTVHSVDISSSGSTENGTLSYFTSLGYYYEDALYNNNDFDRLNFRANLDTKISESIKLTTDFSGNLETRNRPGITASTLFSNLMRTPPIEVNQYSNGGYSSFSQEPAINNSGYRKEEDFEFQSRIALNFELPFIEGLDLTTQVSYDRSAGGFNAARDNLTGSITNFSLPTSYTIFDPATGKFSRSTPEDRGEKGTLFESRAKGFQLTTEAILNYAKTLDKHDLGAKLVYSRTVTRYGLLTTGISNILGTTVPSFIAGDAETRSNFNRIAETGILGYAGRLTYGYDNKYLFEFNGRYDGSYKFSKDARFDFFPSFSFAWRASEENFLVDSNLISNLKIRASYGELGSDAGVDPFRYSQFFTFGDAFIDDSSVAQTIESSGLADPQTTWEKAKTYNLGIELGLWNNKLTLETDVYYKRTSDILTTRALEVPDTFGATLPAENIGVVDNKGFEVILNHNNRVKEFDYFANLNLGYSINEIIDIAEPDDVDPLLQQTGRPIRTRFGYIAKGLFLTQQEIDDLNASAPSGTYQTQSPSPGDIRYADVNGDGEVTDADRTVIGNSHVPKLTFGINLGFNYKNFDFSALFQGATGFDMYLSEEASWAFFNGGKVFDKHLDRAQIGTDGNVINTNASYPRLTLKNNAVNERISSYWVVPGDYLRFKNIEIGYTFPESVIEKMGLDQVRIYFNGRNLVTWSKIKHLDPENPQRRGWFYPQQTLYSLGLNVQF